MARAASRVKSDLSLPTSASNTPLASATGQLCELLLPPTMQLGADSTGVPGTGKSLAAAKHAVTSLIVVGRTWDTASTTGAIAAAGPSMHASRTYRRIAAEPHLP